MKIYTKKGDQGDTQLFGGSVVRKYNVRVEAYGTCDELNCFIARTLEFTDDQDQVVLERTQSLLFEIGSQLAGDTKIDGFGPFDDDVRNLENRIDELNANLPELKHFIIPGGHQSNIYCHQARAICRRTERRVVELSDQKELPNDLIIPYLNRLSDYLFVLSRYMSKKYNSPEIYWQGRQ